MRKALLVAALTVVALAGFATPASAHNSLTGSDPKDGAAIEAGPASITLTFDEPVQGGFNTISVTGPDGARYEGGTVTTRDNTASQQVKTLGPAGKYVIGYRVVSADGHPVSGQLSFTLTKAVATTPPASNAAPASSTAAAAPTTTVTPAAESSGMPVWPWIVGVLVLLVIGVVVALRIGRSTPGT